MNMDEETKEKLIKIAEILAELKPEQRYEMYMRMIIVEGNSPYHAIGMLESMKLNLLLGMMDSKVFLTKIKRDMDTGENSIQKLYDGIDKIRDEK